MSDLLERLRKVECSYSQGWNPEGGIMTWEITSNWHRNPDGPEAADEIERLRELLSRCMKDRYVVDAMDNLLWRDIKDALLKYLVEPPK